MKDFDSDGLSDGEWDDRGDLAWNEFDWEKYLRDQDENILRYLAFYDTFKDKPDRIDEIAERMGWDRAATSATGGMAEGEDDDEEEDDDEDDVYTLHKNPIYIATKALFLSLRRQWLVLTAHREKSGSAASLPYLDALHRGEEVAMQAIHALDFGDYAMAVALFKRALRVWNQTLSLLDRTAADQSLPLGAYREDARQRLFDLREIWLRVISECRNELDRPIDEENG